MTDFYKVEQFLLILAYSNRTVTEKSLAFQPMVLNLWVVALWSLTHPFPRATYQISCIFDIYITIPKYKIIVMK